MFLYKDWGALKPVPKLTFSTFKSYFYTITTSSSSVRGLNHEHLKILINSALVPLLWTTVQTVKTIRRNTALVRHILPGACHHFRLCRTNLNASKFTGDL